MNDNIHKYKNNLSNMSQNNIAEMAERLLTVVPHCQELDISLVSADAEGVEFVMPFNPALEANPGSGIMHSGAITTLLDTVSVTTVLTCLPEPEPCPTLDLRIDHLAMPEPGKAVHAFAEAYHVTRSVVFTRGYAFHTDRNKPFVHAIGTFMRVTSNYGRKKTNG